MAADKPLAYSAPMGEAGQDGLIGVDGGATTCRFALQRGGKRTVVETAGVNVTTNSGAAVETLRDGFAQLATLAQIAPDALADIPAFLGLAGLQTDDAARAIAAALPLKRAEYAEDRLPAVVGALGARAGSVAAIGTGSFLGRQTDEAVTFAGGWGLMLGDEASGAWIGREILAAALRAEDGMMPHTDLTRTVLADLGGPHGAVAFARDATPDAFGAEPRVRAVFEAAAAQDPVATELLGRGATYIATALRALGHETTDPLCLMGSVAPEYAPYLDPNLTVVRPNGTALDGALALAARIGRHG